MKSNSLQGQLRELLDKELEELVRQLRQTRSLGRRIRLYRKLLDLARAGEAMCRYLQAHTEDTNGAEEDEFQRLLLKTILEPEAGRKSRLMRGLLERFQAFLEKAFQEEGRVLWTVEELQEQFVRKLRGAHRLFFRRDPGTAMDQLLSYAREQNLITLFTAGRTPHILYRHPEPQEKG